MKLSNLLPKILARANAVDRPWQVDIDALVADRDAFNAFVYTPIEDAMSELERRWVDPRVRGATSVPNELKNGFKAVIFRQLVTGNYEIRRFVSIIDPLRLQPVFWEYYDDKFTSNNEWKHSLGKLHFYGGLGKKGGAKINALKVIDFNSYNGKRINEVRTLWDEPLVDFHHRFLRERFREVDEAFFDASEWFAANGKTASNYYQSFMALFVKHAILFENFMLDEKEFEFTKEIFLPAFIAAWKASGVKPLIVSLEPTDIEDDKFWICHPFDDHEYVLNHLGGMLPSA